MGIAGGLPAGAGAANLPFTERRGLSDGRFRRALGTEAISQLRAPADAFTQPFEGRLRQASCVRAPMGPRICKSLMPSLHRY